MGRRRCQFEAWWPMRAAIGPSLMVAFDRAICSRQAFLQSIPVRAGCFGSLCAGLVCLGNGKRGIRLTLNRLDLLSAGQERRREISNGRSSKHRQLAPCRAVLVV